MSSPPAPATPGAPPDGRRAVPLASSLASALLGIAAAGTATLGLIFLIAAAMGGGVSVGPGSGSASPPLGLAISLLVGALGAGLGYLALAVYRGRLVPSVISLCLATGIFALGIGRLLFDTTSAGLAEVVRGLGLPLVLLASLVSPSHRQYVSLRRAQGAPESEPGAAPPPPPTP